ncbi:hypothetical protein BD779DRAFT_1217850 [Infundibulicybe gibba]|nr:hypothetical protein BD779DRAFT_1217850 [Infundibulicybe gibba]
MGNGQSLFYPDNGNRYNRAQQLGNDCENYLYQFESKKAELERTLGPYQSKINRVMQAFGCNDLDDLSRLVEKTATGEALAQWNRVKNAYDKTQMVDQVIYGAMGVIAIAGIAISAVGFLAGGIGFLAGIAVTGKILLVIGVVSLIFGAIFGAVNRAKLRDSINSLFESRLKIRRIVAHLDVLLLWMPIIHEIYQVFEEAGSTEEEIIKRLKDRGFEELIQEDMKEESFYNIARSLRDLDESRMSWVNEDPSWQNLANMLQMLEDITSRMATHATIPLQARSLLPQTQKDNEIAAGMNFSLPAYSLDIYGPPPSGNLGLPPPYDSAVGVNMRPAGGAGPVSSIFSNPIEFYLNDFLDERSASVTMRTPNEKFIVSINESKSLALTQTPLQPSWTMVFTDADTEKFKTLWPIPDTTAEILMMTPTTNQYLLADGSFTDKESLATKFTLSYSDSQTISTPAFTFK